MGYDTHMNLRNATEEARSYLAAAGYPITHNRIIAICARAKRDGSPVSAAGVRLTYEGRL